MKRLLSLAACVLFLATGADRFQAGRERMVRDQIEARGIRQPDVLQMLRSTPRHLFVPGTYREQAYEDRPLPIGYGQTISQPYIVAFMTELLAASKRHKVLEIGTGSGYQAAVLAGLADRVFTIEIIPELAASAGVKLQGLGIRNVVVRNGDGYQGWPEEAPFDRIILTAAPPEIPDVLIGQLTHGGRLVAPVGRNAMVQDLVVIDNDAAGKISRKTVAPVTFVPMVKGKQ